MGRLDTYLAKRDFDRTPEPTGGKASPLAPRYSIQNHAARRLHWDLRLEWDGVLLSWAITRGPSLDPSQKRLAVRTEDHPLDYLSFEGTIPKDSYGAGTVMLWDIGYWQPTADVEKGLKRGKLAFSLHGQRLTGAWTLVRMKSEGKRENWLLIKQEDEAAHAADPVERYTTSVSTRRNMQQIAKDAKPPEPPARKAARPRWRAPQLAMLSDRLGDPQMRWHELKFDGYRAMVALGRGGARVFTRKGLDWSEKFAELIPPIEKLPCDSALIDGELTVGAGLYGFGALQKAIKHGGPFSFYAFDLLHLDGTDLTGKPLSKRREALELLFSDQPKLGLLQLSPVLEGDASQALRAVCESGGEGLVSKRKDAPYRGGRSSAWEKIKCMKRAEFVVVGWQSSDKRGRAFASLVLGVREAGQLRYIGKVGTGFDEEAMTDLARLLRPLARETPPVVGATAEEARGVTWVVPKIVVETKFAEMTGEGRLRHASFLGIRADKPADEITLEPPMSPMKSRPSNPSRHGGIDISSSDRVVFPKAGHTKGEVAAYYENVADRMLEHAGDRPLSLLRLPTGLEGERFFQKHAGKGFPDEIRRVEIEEKSGEIREYMYVKDAAGIVAAVQMGAIEFHIWGARRDRLDRPDRMVFDLDPDEGLSYRRVLEAARDIRERLNDLGLASWPLLTGGKGIHVVVPLRRSAGWETVTLFARTFAELCARDAPDRYTASMSKARRAGRIFIDWLRNERGATAISPWSLRARPAAPLAFPVPWEELSDFSSANAVRLKTLPDAKPLPGFPRPATLTKKVIARLEEKIGG